MKIQVLVKEALERLEAKYRESMLARIWRMHELRREAEALAISHRNEVFQQRCDLAEQTRRVKELETQIYFSPIRDADKLLRLIAEIIEQSNINQYELRCWRDDYTQYRIKCSATPNQS